MAFRVLAAGNVPSHRTLCECRCRHLADFRRLFVEVVRLAGETGVGNVGTRSIDGTKVRANASQRQAMSDGRMPAGERRLKEEIAALVERARETDAQRALRGGVPGRRAAGGTEAAGGPAGGDPGGEGAAGGSAAGGGRRARPEAGPDAAPEGGQPYQRAG